MRRMGRMKCYAFAIGGLPDPLLHPIQARKVRDFIVSLEGLAGMHLYDRYHTLLAFETMNQAKRARNRIRDAGNPVGNHIMNTEISEDRKMMTVLGPAD